MPAFNNWSFWTAFSVFSHKRPAVEFGRFCHSELWNFASWPTEFGKNFPQKTVGPRYHKSRKYLCLGLVRMVQCFVLESRRRPAWDDCTVVESSGYQSLGNTIDKWLVVHSLCVASLEKQYSCCCFLWNRISSTLAVVSDGPEKRFSGLACGFVYRCRSGGRLSPADVASLIISCYQWRNWRVNEQCLLSSQSTDGPMRLTAFVTGPALCKRLTA